VIAAAQASHKLYYPKGPYTSVSLAQWAIESAYGKSVSGKNNYFGIKATPAQISSGQATVRWTQEFYDGAYRKVEQWFADYPDENGSFDAHAKLLATSPLYAAAQAAKTVETYVVAMAARYATAPNYSEVILGLIKSAGLTQFDVGAAVPVASTSVATAPPAPAVPPRKVAPPEAVAEVQAKVGQLQNTPAHLTIWEKIKAALEMLEG
jgi:flagellum-specific peptidoglycan hydrolase FlgJ